MPGLQIGDYILESLLETSENQQVWLGEQISVKREIEMVCYYGPEPEQFLADVREKAKVEDGILGLVYEAIPTEHFIAFAREVLPQRSLATISEQGEHLSPFQVCSIIKQVSGAIHSLTKRGIASRPFDINDIRISDQNQIRIHNIAHAGEPNDDLASRSALTKTLRKQLQIGQPGATRMGTLLEYIEGTDSQAPIPWEQAESLAEQVEEQLATSEASPPRPSPVLKKQGFNNWILIAALPFVAIIILLLSFFKSSKPDNQVGLIITVPHGRYPLPNGEIKDLPSFRIDANEVTIGQYEEFMLAWQQMSKKEQAKLWPKGVPEAKTSVRPDFWNDYFPIARSQQTWKGLQMSLECPVMGVDWWDARAYAKWKGGRLPTATEWWAARNSINAAKDENHDWGYSGGAEEKIYGLLGNVAEWAHQVSKNPAFPIESASPVALGGSHRLPSKEALSREWLAAKSIRRDDLGFRLVYPVEQ